MSTALGIIKSAMRKSGILTKTETPSSDESADALEMLNDLLASWSNDSMVVYARTIESFALTGGDNEYTIGSGADFNTTRPIKIISAYIRSGSIDYPLRILDDVNYSRITLKSTQATPSRYLNYDNGYPSAKIKLWPAPASADTLYLVTEKPLASFTLNETVDLPPGWRRALVYNLAMEIAPEYGQPVSQEIYAIAKDSKGEIRAAIMAARGMEWETGATGGDNIYTGWLT